MKRKGLWIASIVLFALCLGCAAASGILTMGLNHVTVGFALGIASVVSGFVGVILALKSGGKNKDRAGEEK